MNKLRIAFTGPECSGKTTISRAVAAALLQSTWVAEVARDYLTLLPDASAYTANDVRAIADQTYERFQSVNGVLVADTEFFVLDIWLQEVFQASDERIQLYRDQFLFDHYFLCAPDFTWEPDPLRQNPHDRDRLFGLYHEALKEAEVPFTVLRGAHVTRLSTALSVVGSIRK